MTLVDSIIKELQMGQAELKESRLNHIASWKDSGSDDEMSDEGEMMAKERLAIKASLIAYVDTSFKVSICKGNTHEHL
jgi:hypothetical protein